MDMFWTYEVVTLFKILLTVVIRLSLYTTTFWMVKASACSLESDIACSWPCVEMQKTDVLEKTNERHHLSASASVPPIITCGVVSGTENNDSSAQLVSSLPERIERDTWPDVYLGLKRDCMLLSQAYIQPRETLT